MELLPAFDGAGNEEMDLDDLSSFFERTTSGLVQDALAGLTGEEEVSVTPTVQVDEVTPSAENGEEKKAEPAQHTNTITDYKELEALVAESTSNYVKTTLHGLSPVPYQPTVPLSTGRRACFRLFAMITDQSSREHGRAIRLSESSTAKPQPKPLLFLYPSRARAAGTSTTACIG